MTYVEMLKAEAEYSKAIAPTKQKGATKAQLRHRAKRFGVCVNCGELFASHTLQQTVDCANARS